MSLKNGDNVKVEYTGMLEDGTVFDSSEKHGKPLEFEIGKGMIIHGFEKAVMEMKVGEEKEVKLKPSEAYGESNPELVKKIPREHLSKEQEPKPGMILLLSLPTGQQVPVKIIEVSDKDVSIDLNHPLAGKTLKFKIKLVSVN